MMPPIFKVGDLVKMGPGAGRYIPGLDTSSPGIVIKIYYEGSFNEALRVVFAGSKIIVRPYDEFELL